MKRPKIEDYQRYQEYFEALEKYCDWLESDWETGINSRDKQIKELKGFGNRLGKTIDLDMNLMLKRYKSKLNKH